MILFFNSQPAKKDKQRLPVNPERKTQNRFVFYLEKCIGCHTCEVACAEQNALPADTVWRRVGEIEGGIFPDIKRYFFSLSCNHCIDPSCMKGCPASAYHINERGIVVHDDPNCIGCSYCTWNCPYGVPVFQKDRKIVTKCDMCSNRLDAGEKPACVAACPAGAIETEEVALGEVIETYKACGAAPGMPDPEISIPSTKIVIPEKMDQSLFFKTNKNIVKPEKPHYSLIFMTVFTQLSVGGLMLSFMADLLRVIIPIPIEVFRSVSYLAPVLFGIAGLSLASSILHLGRPVLFFRAFLNIKTSWLSREALGFAGFSLLAFVYSALLFFSGNRIELPQIGMALSDINDNTRLGVGIFTLLAGVYGVYASSRIYRVPSRPAWNQKKTTFDFFNVMILTGVPLFSHASSVSSFLQGNSVLLNELVKGFSVFAMFFGLAITLIDFSALRYRKESEVEELNKSAYLYHSVFYRENTFRLLVLAVASFLLLMSVNEYFPSGSISDTVLTLLALVMYIVYAFVTRYLFFVTVVPSNMPGNFIVEVNK